MKNLEKRKIDGGNMKKYIFFKAGFYTLLFLCLTLTAAYLLNDYRTNYLSNQITNSEFELLDITISMDLINTTNDCNVLNSYVDIFGKKVGKIGQYLSKINDPDKEKDPNYNKLLTRYNYLNIASWMKHKELQKKCHSNKLDILFIYSKDDVDSIYQGDVLDDMQKKYSLNIYAVASYLNILPMKLIIRKVKNKNKFPILVIDQNIYQGFKNNIEMEKIIKYHLNKEKK